MRTSIVCLFPFLILILSVSCAGERTSGARTIDTVVNPPEPAVERTIQAVGPAPILVSVELEGDTATLSYESYLPGDFNSDGESNGHDLFRLAVHFGHTSSHGGGEPTDDSDDCIDGNLDGVVDGKDLFVLATNFMVRIDGYNALVAQAEEGPFDGEPVNDSLLPYSGCRQADTWQHTVETSVPTYFALSAWDEVAEEAGALSNVGWPDDPPAMPVNLTAQLINLGVNLAWEASADADVEGYNVYRCDDASLKEWYGPVNAELILTTSYRDESLYHPDHFYSVTAVDFYGSESDYQYDLGLPELSWEVVAVPGADDLSQNPSIALDTDGHPAVAYEPVGEYNLVLERFDGTDWQSEVVDELRFDQALTFDLDGNPIIAYGRSQTTLDVAWKKGGEWEYTEVDRDGSHSLGRDLCIMLDASGNPLIAYSQDSDGIMYIAWFNGSTWDKETIDAGPKTGRHPNLELDPDGNPAVAYFNWDDDRGTLKLQWHDGMNWAANNPDFVNDYARHSSLKFHPDTGLPWIAYGDGRLQLVQLDPDGESWTETELTFSANTYTSMAFGPLFNPGIACYSGTSENVWFTYYSNVGWRRDNINESGSLGYAITQMLGPDGRPIIGFTEEVGHDMEVRIAWLQ